MRKILITLCLVLHFGPADAAATVTPPTTHTDLRPAVLLTASQSRDSVDLSGQWTYSKDLYRTGLNDINGWVAKSRMQRSVSYTHLTLPTILLV